MVEHFGYDMVGCGGWFDWLPRRGFSETVEETEDWKVTRNGARRRAEVLEEQSGTPSTSTST